MLSFTATSRHRNREEEREREERDRQRDERQRIRARNERKEREWREREVEERERRRRDRINRDNRGSGKHQKPLSVAHALLNVVWPPRIDDRKEQMSSTPTERVARDGQEGLQAPQNPPERQQRTVRFQKETGARYQALDAAQPGVQSRPFSPPPPQQSQQPQLPQLPEPPQPPIQQQQQARLFRSKGQAALRAAQSTLAQPLVTLARITQEEMQALPLARPRAQQQTQARAHTQAQAQARTLEELRGVGIVASATTAPHQPAVQSTADSSIARPSVIGSSIAGSLSANAPSTSSSQSQSQSSSQSEPQPMPIRKPLGPRHTYPWKSTNDLAQANPIQRPVSMEAAPKPAETPKVHPPESVISAATPAPTAHIQDTSANTASSSDPSLLPEVDIVIHNLHADSRGTSRAVRRLPVAVLLAHMMGIIARRGLLLHSVAATVHSITIVLEDGSIGRRKFGRNSGFSTFVGELVNLPKEVWPGSGGTGSGERNEHIRPEEEADKSDDEEGLLGEVHDLEEKT